MSFETASSSSTAIARIAMCPHPSRGGGSATFRKRSTQYQPGVRGVKKPTPPSGMAWRAPSAYPAAHGSTRN